MAPPWTCPNCGQKISPSIGECLFCPADEIAVAPAAAPPAAPVTAGADRAFELLLFDAEEALARGQAERAMVLASRAAKENPSHLTARSLYERCRRELLKGRRREKLDARVTEAEERAGGGDLDGAERIVASALKLVPDHEAALALFGQIRERRLQGPGAEAEAERELLGVLRDRARRSLEAARRAREAGSDFRAMLAVRRGLALMPGDRELLDLYTDLAAALERARASRRSVPRPRRPAPEPEPALRLLPIEAPAPATPPRIAPPTEPAAGAVPRPPAAAAATPPRTAPVGRPAPARRPPVSPRVDEVVAVRLPATRRRGTPWPLIALGALGMLVGVVFLVRAGSGGAPLPRMPPETVPSAPAAEAPGNFVPMERDTEPTLPPGPLSRLDPALRVAIESVLAAYAGALEAADAERLAAARPDLSAGAREELLSRMRGAVNVAIDLRVLDVLSRADVAAVSVLRTEVIVGGREAQQPPTEETLRFVQRAGEWSLDARR